MRILGDSSIHAEALAQMRERGGKWFAYQNHAMDSVYLGHLQFLRCDPGSTYTKPPARMPDTRTINWA
jgi:hypothetical protein